MQISEGETLWRSCCATRPTCPLGLVDLYTVTFEPPGAKGRRIHILVRYRVHGLWQLDASEDSAKVLAPDHRRSGTRNNQPVGVIRRGTSRKRNGTSMFDMMA